MKRLKGFKIFESDTFLDRYKQLNEIVSYLEDVLIDITDDGNRLDIRRPKYDRWGNEMDIIEISISGKFFKPKKYIDSFDHMNSYLESHGYKFYSNGTMYDTYLQKRNLSLKSDSSFSYLGLTYKK